MTPAHRLTAGSFSTSRPGPTTDSAAQPEQHARREDVAHRGGGILEGAGVGPGHEQRDQVGVGAELLEHLAGDLAHGMGGHRVHGEGGGEGHRLRPGAAG